MSAIAAIVIRAIGSFWRTDAVEDAAAVAH
jgi:hypothetical protein